MARDNKDVVLRQWYDELWNNWNIGVADGLFTEDYTLHLSGVPGPMSREAALEVITMFSAAFPDLKHTVDELIAENESVAARWTAQGTHRGAFQGIPPSGKPIRVWGSTVHHTTNGRISETWLTVDNLDLLQQLGAAPAANREG